MKPKAVFCWSGGKDSSLALHEILQKDEVEVIGLLTTLNTNFKRVSMHGVREELLVMQADSINLPLIRMFVSEGSNDEYERNLESLLLGLREKGVSQVIFGDIFLEDLRAYREKNLARIGMKAVFPLWKRDTQKLIKEFLGLGFKTMTCCVNDAYLNEDHVGVIINEEFIKQLPNGVDPCGENGEYHTFCFEGPIFKSKINFQPGEKIYKPLEVKMDNDLKQVTKGFWFCDLIPS